MLDKTTSKSTCFTGFNLQGIFMCFPHLDKRLINSSEFSEMAGQIEYLLPLMSRAESLGLKKGQRRKKALYLVAFDKIVAGKYANLNVKRGCLEHLMIA